MNSMSPWTPEMIGKLTPLQLLCLAQERPPRGGRSLDEYELAERAWGEGG
jgi:hypothetical protein